MVTDTRSICVARTTLSYRAKPIETRMLARLVPSSVLVSYMSFIAHVTPGYRVWYGDLAPIDLPETACGAAGPRHIRWCGWPQFKFETRFGTMHPELVGRKTWMMVFDYIYHNDALVGVHLGAKASLEQLLITIYSAEDLLGGLLVKGNLGCGLLRWKYKKTKWPILDRNT